MFRKIVISVSTKAIIIALLLATLWIARLWVSAAQARAQLGATTLNLGVLDIGPVELYLRVPTSVPTIESTGDGVGLFVPIWVPLVCFTAYPILVLIRTIRRRLRPKAGHCSKCGYNLTGLPEPRCPECGTGFEG